MDAKLKSLNLGTTRSGRNQLLVVGFVICCLLLPPASESKPIKAGFSIWSGYGNVNSTPSANHEYNTSFAIPELVISSPANSSAVVLHVEYKNSAYVPTCYIALGADIYPWINTYNVAPAPSVNASSNTSYNYFPWSVPCPRKQIAAPQNTDYSGYCIFTFTLDGDLQVLGNITRGPNILYWSSNTSGLGATTMDLLDTDPTQSGSIVLYNNQSQVVWQNLRNMSYQNYNCGEGFSQSTAAAIRISFASHGLLLVLSAALLLHFLAL